MLYKLSPKYHPQYLQSPAAHWLNDFAIWLIDSGYIGKPAQGHVRRLRYVLEHSVQNLEEIEFSNADIQRIFTNAPKQQRRFYQSTQILFKQFLMLIGQFRVEPPTYRFAELVNSYQMYLRDVRGLTSTTVSEHTSTIIRFITKVLPANASLHTLSAQTVEEYVTSEGQRVKRQTLQHVVAQLRSFFRYCYDRGHVLERLYIIDTAITYREESPPRSLPWNLVQRLLCSIDLSSKAGLRDLAILKTGLENNCF